MAETSLPLYVGVETVKQDLGVSRAHLVRRGLSQIRKQIRDRT